MKRASIYTMAVAGFSLSATPPAYAREIVCAGPEADFAALNRDMHAAYGQLQRDVEAETGQAQVVDGKASREATSATAGAGTTDVLARIADR